MLINCDAAALEWRTIVELAKEPIGLSEIVNKEDVHTNNQQAFTLPSRLLAKRFLFRAIYRGSAYAYANDSDFNHVSTKEDFWNGVIDKFFNKYKNIKRVHEEWARLTVAGKPIEGPFGTQWLIDMATDFRGNPKIPWTVLTNYPVQGTGADIMMMARIMFFSRLKKQPYYNEVKLISTVHDSIVVDAPRKYVQQITNLFHEVFADLPKTITQRFDYNWETPLDCEVQVGMNMKNMEKVLPAY